MIHLNIQSVPRSKHYLSYNNQSVLYREIIAVCSQMHTKHTNTLYGLNVVFLSVTLVVRAVSTEPSKVNSVKGKGLLVYAIMALGGLDV